MNVGPQPGDKILLVDGDDDKEMTELFCLLLGSQHLRMTTASTATAAVKALNQPFDLVWLHVPLPDLSSGHMLDDLLDMPDLADRVGTESPIEVVERLMSKSWYTKLGQQIFPSLSNEDTADTWRGILALTKRNPRQHGDRWLWIRIRSDEERDRVKQLLAQSTHN